MEMATLREAVNFENTVKAISPYILGQILDSFATTDYVASAIATATIDPSQIDLSAYAKITDLPTKLSELTNDDNYVQTVSGKIPGILLPSFVDDVEEYSTKSAFPNPGESGKLYVDLSTDLIYRWSGSTYAEISPSLALGETQSTAYRGDRGKTAYDHSQTTGNPHNLTLSDLSITATATEINYLSGLSKNIITALGEKLALSGGTLTGALTLSGAPTADLHAATKRYVDDAIDGLGVSVSATYINNTTYNADQGELNATLQSINTTITTVQDNTKNYTDTAVNNIIQQVYTQQEVDTMITAKAGQIEEDYTIKINQEVQQGNEAYSKIVELEGNITRGIDQVTGKPFIVLSTGDPNGFSLKISNDKISIIQGSTEVSGWSSDQFDVSTVITNSLGLGAFEFIVGKDANNNYTRLTFKHR